MTIVKVWAVVYFYNLITKSESLPLKSIAKVIALVAFLSSVAGCATLSDAYKSASDTVSGWTK